jgi:DUF971 family protein
VPLADPKFIKVNTTAGTGVDIDWKDGHVSHFTFQWLRDACPCATCDEERKKTNRRPGEPVQQAAALLPLYKEKLRPKEVQSVGKYAICFHWNDGHETGIYSWDYLRASCQCAECKAKLAAHES